MSFFITGTDTDVGKTTTAAMLLIRNVDLLYWKPVQTGDVFDRISIQEKIAPELDKKRFIKETYHFKKPLSPNHAASYEKKKLYPKKIIRDLAKNKKKGRLAIEGAGGLLVPLTDHYTWLDFLKETKLPVVIVARTSLGTINHSLLTVQSLKNAKIPIIAFVFCGPDNPDNVRTICKISKVPMLCSFNYDHEKNLSYNLAHIECLKIDAGLETL